MRQRNAVPPARLDVDRERGVETFPSGALDKVGLVNEEVLWSYEKTRIYSDVQQMKCGEWETADKIMVVHRALTREGREVGSDCRKYWVGHQWT